jgi:hypothetical protein
MKEFGEIVQAKRWLRSFASGDCCILLEGIRLQYNWQTGVLSRASISPIGKEKTPIER